MTEVERRIDVKQFVLILEEILFPTIKEFSIFEE